MSSIKESPASGRFRARKTDRVTDARAAAYHQAGHLIFCVYYRIGVLEIRPSGSVPVDIVLVSASPSSAPVAENYFKMLVAGGIAEGRYRMGEDCISDEDKLRIRQLCLRVYPAATTSAAVMDRLIDRSCRAARIHLADPRMWRAVQDLATHLVSLDQPIRDAEIGLLFAMVRDRLRD